MQVRYYDALRIAKGTGIGLLAKCISTVRPERQWPTDSWQRPVCGECTPGGLEAEFTQDVSRCRAPLAVPVDASRGESPGAVM
jgi:hypothetical protein